MRKFFPLSLSVILLCSCASQNESAISKSADAVSAKNQWTARGHIAPEDFIIQSHRGAGELAPENTLGAFELGWSLGTIPEADIRTTKDGVIVAFHDSNFKRTVKTSDPVLQKKGVADVTWAELSQLDVGGWKGENFEGRRVSKISDVFKLMTGKPDRQLYLDIKSVDLKQLADEVRENKVTKQVIFTTTKYDLLRDWKKLVPNSQTLNWMGGTEEQLKGRLAEVRAANFEGITQLQLHVRVNTNNPAIEPFTLSRGFLRSVGTELRERGILYQSLPWDVADPEVYWQLLDLGLMSFSTDHPKVTVEAVRDYLTRPQH